MDMGDLLARRLAPDADPSKSETFPAVIGRWRPKYAGDTRVGKRWSNGRVWSPDLRLLQPVAVVPGLCAQRSARRGVKREVRRQVRPFSRLVKHRVREHCSVLGPVFAQVRGNIADLNPLSIWTEV